MKAQALFLSSVLVTSLFAADVSDIPAGALVNRPDERQGIASIVEDSLGTFLEEQVDSGQISSAVVPCMKGELTEEVLPNTERATLNGKPRLSVKGLEVNLIFEQEGPFKKRITLTNASPNTSLNESHQNYCNGHTYVKALEIGTLYFISSRVSFRLAADLPESLVAAAEEQAKKQLKEKVLADSRLTELSLSEYGSKEGSLKWRKALVEVAEGVGLTLSGWGSGGSFDLDSEFGKKLYECISEVGVFASGESHGCQQAIDYAQNQFDAQNSQEVAQKYALSIPVGVTGVVGANLLNLRMADELIHF